MNLSKPKLLQIVALVTLMFYCSFDVYGSCCRTPSITYSYYQSDIVTQGVISKKESLGFNNIIAVTIEIERDFKSDQPELTAYLNESSLMSFGTQGCQIGDEVILFQSSSHNNPASAQVNDYHCFTNMIVLKKESQYPNRRYYESAKKYYEFVQSTINWLSSLPLLESSPNSCLLLFPDHLPLFQSMAYLGKDFEVDSNLTSKPIFFIVEITNGRIVGYDFSANATTEDIERINSIFHELSCVCINSTKNIRVPVSLVLFPEKNKGMRI